MTQQDDTTKQPNKQQIKTKEQNQTTKQQPQKRIKKNTTTAKQ